MFHNYTLNYSNGLINTNLNDLMEDYNNYAIIGLSGGLSYIENRFRVNKFHLVLTDNSNRSIIYNKNCLVDVIIYNEDTMADDDLDEGNPKGTYSTNIKNKYFSDNSDVITTGYLLLKYVKGDFEMIGIYFGINFFGRVVAIKIDSPVGQQDKIISSFKFDMDIEINEQQEENRLN